MVFAVGGLLVAFVPGVPHPRLPPDLVLLAFLPPLIFAAARNTSWAEVRANLRPIVSLAVGLVLATLLVVAAVTKLVDPRLPWATCFTLGAIVGPPDAVAATSVAAALRLPRPLVEVLEGEGLFNDVTALVAFQIATGFAVAGGAIGGGSVVGHFFASAGLATAAGLLVGWLGHKALRLLPSGGSPVVLVLIQPFAAYLLAERFHASGVLAVLALALYLSNLPASPLSTASRLLTDAMWEIADFLLVGLSFVLMGLQLPVAYAGENGAFDARLPWLVIAVCLTVALVRPLWVFGVGRIYSPVRRSGIGDEPLAHLGRKEKTVVSWAGMRGVISLALALSLPEAFPGRPVVLVVTFATIFFTLVGQGLSLPLLIGRLRLSTPPAAEAADLESRLALRLTRTALAHLDEIATEEGVPGESIVRAQRLYDGRLEALEWHRDQVLGHAENADQVEVEEGTRRLMGRLHELQHTELQSLRNAGKIDTPTAARLQRRLDILDRARA